MALTATANKKAVQDIIDRLGISTCKRFTMSFNRSNLFYEVLSKKGNGSASQEDIIKFIRENYAGATGIIYFNNKKQCDAWATHFCSKGVLAASYHADLSWETKKQLQDDWQCGKIHLIIATVCGLQNAGMIYRS